MDKETTRGITLILGKRCSGKTTKAKEIIRYSAKPEQKIYVVTYSAHSEEYEKENCSFDTCVYPYHGLSFPSLEEAIEAFKEHGLEEQPVPRYVILDGADYILKDKDLPLAARKYNIRFIVVSQEFRYPTHGVDCIHGMGITTEEERDRIERHLGIKLHHCITHFKYEV